MKLDWRSWSEEDLLVESPSEKKADSSPLEMKADSSIPNPRSYLLDHSSSSDLLEDDGLLFLVEDDGSSYALELSYLLEEDVISKLLGGYAASSSLYEMLYLSREDGSMNLAIDLLEHFCGSSNSLVYPMKGSSYFIESSSFFESSSSL